MINKWIYRPACVYFIAVGEFIKIGMSYKVEQRLRKLQSSLPFDIRLIGYYYAGEYAAQDERGWHDIYKQYRIRGEYFKLPEKEIKEMMFKLSQVKNFKTTFTTKIKE